MESRAPGDDERIRVQFSVEYGRKEQESGMSRVFGIYVATPGCYQCTGWGEKEAEGPDVSREVDL